MRAPTTHFNFCKSQDDGRISGQFGTKASNGRHLVVLDGLGERLHLDRLVQLVLVQQLDEEVQRALVDAHLRVQRAHLLVRLHAALAQRSEAHARTVLEPAIVAHNIWKSRLKPSGK